MGRQALPQTAAPAVPEAKARKEAIKREEALTSLREQLLEGRPYDAEQLLREGNSFLQSAAMSFLEFGKRMLVIKEHEGANFWPLLKARGIVDQTDERVIQKGIQAAGKFCLGVSMEKQLRLADLGKSKLMELVVLDDQEVKQLADGGTVAGGLDLDDIDRMGTTELRKTLRKVTKKLDDTKDTTERLLADKDKRLNELDREVRRVRKLTPDEAATAEEELELDIQKQLADASAAFLVEVQRFQKLVMAAHAQAPTEASRLSVDQAVQFTFQRINQIAIDAGVNVDFAAIVQPEWLLSRHKKPGSK